MIAVKDVTKRFDTQGGVLALSSIDLTVPRGQMVSIVGPSGSGKTTLLNLIGALDRPTAGDIVIDGQTLGALSPSQLSDLRLHRLGFIFQSYNLIPVLSALENAEF